MTPPPTSCTAVHCQVAESKPNKEERQEQRQRKLESEKRGARAMAEDPSAWTPGIINLPWDAPGDEDEISVYSLQSLVESFPGSVKDVILPEPEPRDGGQEVVMEEEDGEEDAVPRGRCRYYTAGVVMLLVVATVSLVAVMFTDGNDLPNEEPSSAAAGEPASSREQAFQAIVEDLSGVDLLKDDSPQSKALQWLVWQDPAKLEPTASERQIQERYILAVFYFATTGEEWLDSYDFISEKHVCDWKNHDFGMGVTCDQASNTVQAILIGMYCTAFLFYQVHLLLQQLTFMRRPKQSKGNSAQRNLSFVRFNFLSNYR
jgi:hypothetical protein